MATQALKRVAVIAGLGNGSGTGAATARLLAKKGYDIALIARGTDTCKKVADQIIEDGGVAKTFPLSAYDNESISAAWSSIHTTYPSTTHTIRVCLYNVSHGAWKPFLEITPEDINNCLNLSVAAAFHLARGAILAFKENPLDDLGKRGTLIFTGATASIRGNTTTSAFAAGKFGLRALSQSLAKEFGKENIHVAHAVIDGGIMVDWLAEVRGPAWAANEDGRLKPESIANTYYNLINQDRSAWTWELDLRPAHEKW